MSTIPVRVVYNGLRGVVGVVLSSCDVVSDEINSFVWYFTRTRAPPPESSLTNNDACRTVVPGYVITSSLPRGLVQQYLGGGFRVFAMRLIFFYFSNNVGPMYLYIRYDLSVSCSPSSFATTATKISVRPTTTAYESVFINILHN